MFLLILSIIIISIIGTLSHFLYDISNHNKIIGLFTSVNESTWEHIKIALTPTIFWSLIDGYIYGSNPNYFMAKSLSLITIILLIPIMFYTHKYITNKNIFLFDIISFYIVIIFSQLMFYFIINLNPISFLLIYLSCLSLFIIFGSYLLLTLLPLKNFIFKDPITNKYGFKAHSS